MNKKILDQITDFGLFLWYLDDGYLNIRRYSDGNIKEYRIFLYTMNFTFEEVVVIKNWFIERYNISPNINKKQNKIYILPCLKFYLKIFYLDLSLCTESLVKTSLYSSNDNLIPSIAKSQALKTLPLLKLLSEK